MKWTDCYKTEQELIDDMMLTLSDERTAYYYQLVKGYKYIDSFKKYYQKNGKLTDKQMTQLKRLAPEVYKNVHEVRKAR
jgi:hypothetical protein